jgi:hypothetical protein
MQDEISNGMEPYDEGTRKLGESIASATRGAGTWLGEGTDHPDGLHVPVDEGEETLSAKGHVLLLLAQLGFLHVLSASSRLQL